MISLMATMHLGKAVRSVAGGSELDILVSPRSGASKVEGFDQWRQRVTVKVRAPPADGRANREIVSLFETLTGSEVGISHGAGGRMKTLRIAMDMVDLETLMERY